MTDADGAATSSSDGDYVEVDRGSVIWRFEREFLASNWSCIFGAGCHGILPERASELQQGCCSLGAHFGDGPAGEAEAMTVAAYAAALDPARFQFHREAADRDAGGIFGDEERTHTRVVDGACIFLNRPGFAGGSGCALHLAALDADESPTEWKPSVCWQLPLRVEWTELDERRERATVRRWRRADWGDHGTTMAWCCTEREDGGEAYCGDSSVIDSMRESLVAIAGEEVYGAVAVELRRPPSERVR